MMIIDAHDSKQFGKEVYTQNILCYFCYYISFTLLTCVINSNSHNQAGLAVTQTERFPYPLHLTFSTMHVTLFNIFFLFKCVSFL